MKMNLENIINAALSGVKVILKDQVVIFETLECNTKKSRDRTSCKQSSQIL
jgi:hypothetical protein